MVSYGKLLLLCLICLPVVLNAQQFPQYTMYMANNFIVNPALAGIESYTDVRLAARSQWTGVTDAPKTIYATFNSPLRGKYDKPSPIGIGVKVFVDQTGPILFSSAEINGAYHLPVNETYKLSFGMGAGLNYQYLDLRKVQLKDPADPVYSTVDVKQASPIINAGLWFYSNDLYVGVSGLNLLGGNFETTSNGTLSLALVQHYFATVAYRFKIGNIFITPSAMLKYVRPLPVTYDINVKGQFSDAFWAGISWRNRDGVAAMAGFFINNALNVAYSYDFINSDLRQHSLGSHEIILGININNERGPKCPTIVW